MRLYQGNVCLDVACSRYTDIILNLAEQGRSLVNIQCWARVGYWDMDMY